jgi:hypothetical protein
MENLLQRLFSLFFVSVLGGSRVGESPAMVFPLNSASFSVAISVAGADSWADARHLIITFSLSCYHFCKKKGSYIVEIIKCKTVDLCMYAQIQTCLKYAERTIQAINHKQD